METRARPAAQRLGPLEAVPVRLHCGCRSGAAPACDQITRRAERLVSKPAADLGLCVPCGPLRLRRGRWCRPLASFLVRGSLERRQPRTEEERSPSAESALCTGPLHPDKLRFTNELKLLDGPVTAEPGSGPSVQLHRLSPTLGARMRFSFKTSSLAEFFPVHAELVLLCCFQRRSGPKTDGCARSSITLQAAHTSVSRSV